MSTPQELTKEELVGRLVEIEGGHAQSLSAPERHARELETSLGRILQSSLNEIYVFDEQTLRFIMVNSGALENLGYTLDEMQELTPLDIKPEYTAERFEALVQPLRSGQKERVVFETVHRRKDGSSYPVEVHLELTSWNSAPAFMAVILDSTEQERVEEKFRAVVESVANGIVMVGAEGEIVLVNSQAEKYFGYDRQELMGEPVETLIPERFRGLHPGHRRKFFEHPKARAMGAGRDLYGVTKDGREFPVEIGLSPLETDEGLFVIAVIVDITDRKRLEKEILEISEAEKRRIGEDIHDDLCQQLAGIGCLAKVLEKKLRDESPESSKSVAEIGAMISQAQSRAREVARGLVTGVLETEGLQRALIELAGSTQKLFGVRCIVRGEEAIALDDRKIDLQLYRIAQEAIGNAVRHGRAALIEIGLEIDDGKLKMEIVNDGVGFEAPREGHSGLGVLTMHHRASMLNGELEIVKGEESGTRVTCRLPLPGAARE